LILDLPPHAVRAVVADVLVPHPARRIEEEIAGIAIAQH
jgi:hypothetical protein